MEATLYELPLAGRTWVLDAHGVFLTLGALFGVFLVMRTGEDEAPRASIRDLAIELLLAGVIGGRVLGLGFYGGLAAACAWLAYRSRKTTLSTLAWADLFAPGVALAEAIGRAGWLVFRDDAPVQSKDAVDVILHLALLGALLVAKKKHRRAGVLFAAFVVLDAILRFSLR